MSTRIREWLALLDERTSRERFLVCLTLLAGVFVLWNALLMSPLKRGRTSAEAEIEANRNTVTRLDKEVRELENKLKLDPNALNRQSKAELEQQIWRLDEKIVEETADLIPPQEMTRALRELLRGKQDLDLVSMETLPPEPLYGRPELGAKASDPEANAQVYLHTVELELEGSYLSALRYVSAIESLEWNLLWDALEYRVQEYPSGRIKLRVRSLSTREGWIGA